MSDTFKYFEVMIVVQLFYAFAVTLIVYSLPPDTVQYVSVYQTDIDIEQTSMKIQESIQKQMDIPVVDLGALVFYSGNIVIDLMLNFFTAVPGMLNIVLSGVFTLLNVDAYIATNLKIFTTAVFTIIYVIGLLQFIMNVRARGTIV